MRCIVTGATSFLGRVLINRLLKDGHHVVAVCRHGALSIETLPVGVEVILADMNEYGDLYHAVSQADVWVNLAWGGTGHSGRDSEEIQQTNVIYSTAAMSCADKMGCRLFVETGSQAEYGIVNTVIQEATPCHPFSAYGKAKLKVKERLTELSATLGIKYLHLRIFSLIGEGDHPWTLVMSCIDRMLRHAPIQLSSCTQYWNFLYVGDAAEQIVRLCEYALSNDDFTHDVFNIASDDTRPLKNFVDEMYHLTASHSQLLYGAIPQQHVVSLQPDITKLRQTIGLVSTTPFADVIQRIIHTLYNDKGK